MKKNSALRSRLVFAVVLAAVTLWSPAARELHIASDDREQMEVSRDVAGGRWGRLLEFHDQVHLIPLFRLVRLPFDLHFPERFHWMHAVAVAAHLASVVLLYRLSRRYLEEAGALAASALFALNGLGAEALIIKSQNTYVLSLPLVLGALLLLLGGRAAAAAGALAAGVGLHAETVLPAIPAVLISYYLLEGPREKRRAAWIACGAPLVMGGLAWAALGSPELAAARASHSGVAARLWDGVWGAALHYGFLVRHEPPSGWVVAAGALGLAAALAAARNRRLPAAGLALSALPLVAILMLRGGAGYQTSRYCYQSFVAVALAAGAAVDRAAATRFRTAAAALLVALAPVYYLNQRSILQRKTALLRFTPSVTREFWTGWAAFFDSLPPGFRLPAAEVEPGLWTPDIFALCNPKGRPGVTALGRREATAADCENFRLQAAGREALRLSKTGCD